MRKLLITLGVCSAREVPLLGIGHGGGVFQDIFRRIDGTDEFTHSVVGFDFQGKVAGRGPLVFWDVGRKVFDPETGEIVFRSGRTNLAEGPSGA